MNVAAWLRELGLERYVQAFEDNDVDARTLCLLTEADLTEIGVQSVGHRRKLAEAIAALADESSAPVSTPAPPPVPRIDAERRQLSVLYCQMTGFAESSGESADAEDRREVVRSFHNTCTYVVAAYDGHAANFYGDCMLAYFGWPRAHEDDAERAVRAGLALVREVWVLQAGSTASARVGIATGSVVVGDLIHEGPAREQSAVGVTPNLAARVLGIAAPGQVVIDELTRRLLAPGFAVQSLGRHAFKGIDQAVPTYAVSGEPVAESRFDAHNGQGQDIPPMIGRDQELALLLERWAQAQGGEGHAVLLLGEAGIGKSRLVRALLDACAGERHRQVRWQCSQHHTGSALWPVIQALGSAVGLGNQGTDAVLDSLEALTGRGGEAAALYATLLGLNGSQRYGPLEMTPQMLRARLLELLVEQLLETAEERPLLVVVEDAHWIDPTTLELIEYCLARVDTARLMLLVTSRPDNEPKLGAHPSVTKLWLNRLSRTGVESIVARLGGQSLRAETLATIVTRTDGVPLFVEELTKAVLETGEAAIPASLHGSLIARLDRLPEVKEVAQIAACIGRDFDQALVKAVAERPEAVAAALDRLAAAGLVFRRGDAADARCTFKHALVQEAAYQNLLRSNRQAIHARILQVLETRWPKTSPEILAHHAHGAQLADRAIDYWGSAGDAALAKSAYAEAASCFGNAIELIRTQADLIDRCGRELELQLQLGRAYRSSRGYGAESTVKAFDRAYELLQGGSGETRHRFSAQYGLWAAHANRGEPRKALQRALEALSDAKAGGQPDTLMRAHRIVAVSYALLGDFTTACDHFEQTIALLPSATRSELSAWHGSDSAAGCFVWLAWVRQIQGLAEESDKIAVQARSIVAGLSQVDDKAVMHFLLALRSAFVRDLAAVGAHIEALDGLAAGHGLRMHKGYVECLRGWMASASHRLNAEVVTACEAAMGELSAMEARLYLPFFWASLAFALAGEGRHEEASNTIERAIATCEESAQGWCDAELWRVRGEVILRDPEGRTDEAVRSFESAVAIARARGARLWELRSAVSLARAWADQGDSAGALQLLAPICAWFAEGVQTVDLVEARALLAELGCVA